MTETARNFNKKDTDGIRDMIANNIDNEGNLNPNLQITKSGSMISIKEGSKKNPKIKDTEKFCVNFFNTCLNTKIDLSSNPFIFLFLYKETGKPMHLKRFVDLTRDPNIAKLYAVKCEDKEEKIKYLRIAQDAESINKIEENETQKQEQAEKLKIDQRKKEMERNKKEQIMKTEKQKRQELEKRREEFERRRKELNNKILSLKESINGISINLLSLPEKIEQLKNEIKEYGNRQTEMFNENGLENFKILIISIAGSMAPSFKEEGWKKIDWDRFNTYFNSSVSINGITFNTPEEKERIKNKIFDSNIVFKTIENQEEQTNLKIKKMKFENKIEVLKIEQENKLLELDSLLGSLNSLDSNINELDQQMNIA